MPRVQGGLDDEHHHARDRDERLLGPAQQVRVEVVRVLRAHQLAEMPPPLKELEIHPRAVLE
eukprot:341424-Alexandrium_andersonii.AAC.1